METQETRLIPKPFSISLMPIKRSHFKYFRPKEFREMVFPQVGMIIYHLFWTKYVLYLEFSMRIDINKQDFLFFFAEREEVDGIKPLAEEGILYYSLLSAYILKTDEIVAGKLWTSNFGIFQTNWDVNILSQFENLIRNCDSKNIEEFVNRIFKKNFKEICRIINIDLIEKFQDLIPIIRNGKRDSNPIMKDLIAKFVNILTSIIFKNKEQFAKQQGKIINPNIDFVRNLINKENVPQNKIRVLSNNHFDFTYEEIDTFCAILNMNQFGQNFLRSFLILAELVSTREKSGQIWKLTRDLALILENAIRTKKLDTIKAKFHLESISNESLYETCFYWDFNHFLADGEELASLIIKENKILSRSEIDSLLNQKARETLRRFKIFLDKFDIIRQKYMENAIEWLSESNSKRIIKNIKDLFQNLIRYKEPIDIILKQMENMDVIKEIGKDVYSFTAELPKDNAQPAFYGIDAFLSWVRTMISVVNLHE